MPSHQLVHFSAATGTVSQVTTRLLLDTQAGKRIKRLGSHKDPAVSQAAAKVVAAWKQTVKQEQLQTSASGDGRSGWLLPGIEVSLRQCFHHSVVLTGALPLGLYLGSCAEQHERMCRHFKCKRRS